MCILNQPLHGAQYIRLCRLLDRIRLVVGQDHHIFATIVVALRQEIGHIVDVVDAAFELSGGAKVVDTN